VAVTSKKIELSFNAGTLAGTLPNDSWDSSGVVSAVGFSWGLLFGKQVEAAAGRRRAAGLFIMGVSFLSGMTHLKFRYWDVEL